MLAQWYALSDAERLHWLQWEYDKLQAAQETVDNAMSGEKKYAEVVTTAVLIQMLLNG